jgi:hypothetical protein
MTPFVSILTPVHVAISLVGILTGFVVVFDMLSSSSLDGWTKIFLHSTLLTSLTGFLYPIHGITLGIILGILSLIVLAIAYPARYKFALVAQLYEKVPALHALAPMNSEPPFKFTQLAVLLLFFILGILSSIKFHPAKS